jgi:AcrR family transcriptional regulator
MGRPARFDAEQILDAAADVVGEGGPAEATIARIAGRLGAPVGSVYHRFASRDLLLARLWLRSVRRFQQGFLDALADGDALRAALHTPRWCRAHLAEARVLIVHRREDLAARWPKELGEEPAGLNSAVRDALEGFAGDRLPLERVVFALVDVPHAAVRRHIADGRTPPDEVDELVTETCRAVLGAPSVGSRADTAQ